MSAYKEIVTKAVVGKGKKYYKNTYKVNSDSPNKPLASGKAATAGSTPSHTYPKPR